MTLIATCEPYVFIEEQRVGYIRYRDITTGRRWEVHGICDKRGDCLVGAVIDGEEVKTIERARELAAAYIGPDCPVTPEFTDCCEFTYVELPNLSEIE